jgi:hypothetical protein
MLTTHPLLVPRSRKSRSYTSCHPNAPPWRVEELLYFFLYVYKLCTANSKHRPVSPSPSPPDLTLVTTNDIVVRNCLSFLHIGPSQCRAVQACFRLRPNVCLLFYSYCQPRHGSYRLTVKCAKKCTLGINVLPRRFCF